MMLCKKGTLCNNNIVKKDVVRKKEDVIQKDKGHGVMDTKMKCLAKRLYIM